MSKKHVLIGLLLLVSLVVSCDFEAPPTVEPPPATDTSAPPAAEGGLLISEVLPGIHGVNNNLEFIELYNAGSEIMDIQGWSLWYRLADDKEEERIYFWGEQADVPGHGHFLLVRAEQDVGNIGDDEFDTSLFEKKGGLALRNADGETVDTLVWGDGPGDYMDAGAPAPAPEGGASLERLPGGDEGNGVHTGDNAADFVANSTPNPQNSGDALTPLPQERLAVHLDVPASVEPGSEVAYTFAVENLTGGPVHDVRVWVPLPPEFEIVSLPDGVMATDGALEWILAELDSGATESAAVVLQSPWTYLDALIRGYYAEAADGPARAYGSLATLSVAGGAIPISTARTLRGETVTVEGVAIMYTDGFYAGGTGTKFYVEDETGGIQAYCPGGRDLVSVSVGDQVRVTGLIDVYRDSVEIIPYTYPDDVEVLEPGGEKPEPTSATLKEASSDENLLGRLIVVEGTASRIAEFTYSYEVDLMDDQGGLVLLYIEKDAGLTAEPLDVGNRYRVTGISELYDGTWQVKPRFQSDMAEVFPPELMLEMDARNSVLPGGAITYTLTAYNHTDTPLSNVRIEAVQPIEAMSSIEVLDGGRQEGDVIIWIVPDLAGGGESATVRYVATVDDDAVGQILAQAAVATADEWPEPAMTDSLLTFVGSGVPIWAIQGTGATSPYVRDWATTEGVVIGVFPELGGFWIQEIRTDDDPATSAGLFVLFEDLLDLSAVEGEGPVKLGDLVRVSGKVRELSGQTLLHVLALEDIAVLNSDNALPEAVALNPSPDDDESAAYYEALEGMLVQVGEPAVAVGPTSRYGETPLVLSEWDVERIMKGDPLGLIIFVDDGSSATHYDLSTLPFALQTGDLLVDVAGPLAYTYENFKIEPIVEPSITSIEQPLPTLEPTGLDEFSIATFNVENLFDPSDPHPDDPPIPSRSQYNLDLTKTAAAIAAMGAPTIVGLQEVENIDILADLAEQQSVAEYGYQPFLLEGTDSRGIDVGYLVRGDQATVEGVAAYPAPEGLTSRPPLLITVTVHLASGDQTVYVFNNHFTSMSGGEKPTEPRRKAQAAWNGELVQRILEKDPDAHVAVLGDLNSFYDSPPLDVLQAAGLRHVYEFVEPDRPYTYIYQGESEALDHILVTPPLFERLARVVALHISADYPLPIPGDPSARRASDHDPLVVVFSFE